MFTTPDLFAETRNVGAVLFMFIGMIALVVGIALTGWRVFELSTMAKAQGVVVHCPKDRKMYQYWPCVEYTVDGQAYMAYSTVHTEGIQRPGKGEKVTVYYRPEDPTVNRLGLWLDCWFVPTLVSGVGFMFVVGPGFLLFTSRERAGHEDASGTGQGTSGAGGD